MATQIISISLPATLTKAMDRQAKVCSQTRSEFVRAAIQERIAEEREELLRFNHAMKMTKNDKRYTLEEIKKALKRS